ncbi:NAD binding domain of 6-phosphogluconate dehydrogenase [Modicisalibacter muralis]|uniref:NAD binding domain of 6-phosphogluconate dehydrogenase n=1 Tax=Modicisalibacter muralis TaxID=119000 RepID=A0A1G9LJZ9_9GAMM|nr:NAD(P)-binding domain-containing protein [Halomonas muralis]SDL62282.1 NAD binding domain of 6-phosphogluconate dehydrogenase [Halomonas muralis]
MQAIDNIVVYGLGNMGYLVAERIARRFAVTVFDVDEEKVKKAEASFGAKALASQKALPGKSVVVLSLPRPDISQAVLETLASNLESGSIVVETSTVNPEHIHKSQEILEPYGISIVDASVLAGVSQMEAGSATLLLGGIGRPLPTASRYWMRLRKSRSISRTRLGRRCVRAGAADPPSSGRGLLDRLVAPVAPSRMVRAPR